MKRRRFPSDPRDNRLAEKPSFSGIKLVRQFGKVALHGVVHYSAMPGCDGNQEHERALWAGEQHFVYEK
jgi:hypothetical protein